MNIILGRKKCPEKVKSLHFGMVLKWSNRNISFWDALHAIEKKSWNWWDLVAYLQRLELFRDLEFLSRQFADTGHLVFHVSKRIGESRLILSWGTDSYFVNVTLPDNVYQLNIIHYSYQLNIILSYNFTIYCPKEIIFVTELRLIVIVRSQLGFDICLWPPLGLAIASLMLRV